MKIIQNPDGTISVINEEEKPDGFIEDISTIEKPKSEIPHSLINECELLSNDGNTRFIFDRYISSTVKKMTSYKKEDKRDISIDEILSDGEYYIGGIEEFELAPSRFSFYDTETKMTCRYKRHKFVTDFFKKLGFEPGLSNFGPEYEQGFTLSVYGEKGEIIYKCVVRIQPNIYIHLVAEFGDFIENRKKSYKGFFNKSEVLKLLNDTCPFDYKSVIRDIKLKEVLE